MENLQIQAQTRTSLGSKSGSVRREGFIPAELYGSKIANTHIQVKQNEFEKLFRKAGESTIIELVGDDGSKHNVLIHDIQRHPLTSSIIHVDFYEVSMTEKLKASVALEFVGESKAVKEQGGVLVKVLDEVEVECLPADLPHNLPVDLNILKTFSDTISVSQISVPNKVVIITPGDEMVAKVQPPRDVEAELSTPVVEDVTTVEGVVKEDAVPEAEAKAE